MNKNKTNVMEMYLITFVNMVKAETCLQVKVTESTEEITFEKKIQCTCKLQVIDKISIEFESI